MSAAAELRIGKYRAVVGMTSGAWLAQGYILRRKLAEADGSTRDEALRKLRRKLEDRDAAERAGRQEGIPTALEFREALEVAADRLDQAALAILRHHANARSDGRRPDHTLPIGEIAAAIGSGDFNRVLESYDKAGKLLAEYLDYFDPFAHGAPRKFGWSRVLVTGDAAEGAGPLMLTLRPAVVAALYDLGMAFRPAG
jgi:hypothetical protein